MGKGSSIRPYNKAKFDKNWDRIFKVRKGTKAKQTQFHKDRKKEEMFTPLLFVIFFSTSNMFYQIF